MTVEALEFSPNPFRGVVTAPDALPANPDDFRPRLAYSIDSWTNEGYTLVWLEVPEGKASLIPIAVDSGFTFHHTGDGYLMLVRRLVEDTTIPPFASHYIGAGGVVVNNAQELLVVRERRLGAGQRSFKLPGGLVEAGEHLTDGVVREVFEETGIRTRFRSVASFRSQHGYRHAKSDIYFACRLEPLTNEITIQVEEIEECRWMPVSEYLGSETVSAFNKSIVRATLESPGLAPMSIDGYSDPQKRELYMPALDQPLDA